jgi:hypothetical protein
MVDPRIEFYIAPNEASTSPQYSVPSRHFVRAQGEASDRRKQKTPRLQVGSAGGCANSTSNWSRREAACWGSELLDRTQ